MAEAILKYDLNDSDDAMAHMRAVKSLDMALALWDITHNTKKRIEWSLESKELNKYEVLDLVYERIYEILDEHNIKLDDLII
jgi:hypothetical protein